MRVVREHDVNRFRERTAPYLEQWVAENNLLLGLIGDLAVRGVVPGLERELGSAPSIFLSVEGESGIEAVALQTPPRGLVMSRAPIEGTAALVAFVLSEKLALPGVIGPEQAAERFASMWSARTGRPAALRIAEMVYELERVTPPATSRGALREATRADEDLLARWSEAFLGEVGMDPMADYPAFVRAKMAARQLFLWEDGGPVAMAAWGGRTQHGVRIQYVYTPPAARKKGYASAAVAALSARLLAEGCPRCFLFTNAANPTSNKIYQAIGYEFVCKFRFYDFPAA